MRAVGDDLDVLLDQAVDDPADRLFVAGDGARGEDHPVAGRERGARMLLLGHPRQRRARLALASRRQRQHFVARQPLERVGAEERRQAVEIAAFAGDRDDALHRPPHHQHLPPGRQPRLRRGAQPRDVGGEGGDDDAGFRLGDELAQRARDVGLRRALALAHDIGGIADQREHALVAERAQPRLVGAAADAGVLVDLPVAGVDDEAGGGADGERRALGDRMRDGDEFDVERADLDAAAERRRCGSGFSARRARSGGAPRRGRRRSASCRRGRRWTATAPPRSRCDPRARG